MKNVLPLLIVVALMSSCNGVDPSTEYKIHLPMVEYVDHFYQEGEQRGIILKKENLMVIFDSSNKHGVNPFYPGVSTKYGAQRVILIDLYTFEHQDSVANEVMLFHELGHSLLNQKHRDDVESIMNTAPDLHAYKGDSLKRVLMLDELFYFH